ncbi:MAG: hypothetical protein G01um101420_920 [Parcubacteria group bacterium Gr01-1014_20]|nr:MAG: hypothetical protein G01um101420_920 [Parcubacteria group bacterium Gr01-1014_20]
MALMSDAERSEYRGAVAEGIGEAKWTFWKIFWVVVGLIVVLTVAGFALGLFGETAQVAQEQFGPRASLAKYEWFIERATMIEKADADVAMFEGRVRGVDEQYAAYGPDKAKWAPHIQAEYNSARQQARDDLVSVKSQRNNLAREYNAASEKFNWAPFQTNVDKPREKFQELVL